MLPIIMNIQNNTKTVYSAGEMLLLGLATMLSTITVAGYANTPVNPSVTYIRNIMNGSLVNCIAYPDAP